MYSKEIDMPYKEVGINEFPSTAQASDRPAPRRIGAYKCKIIIYAQLGTGFRAMLIIRRRD